jgi:PST family polysaccharide transporter
VRRLVRSTALLGVGSAATIVAAILRAKILAALLGPQGTGVIAQLSTLTAVLVPLATLGMGNGVIAMIAEARSRGDLLLVRRIHATSLTLSLLVGVLLAILAALASPWLTDAIYHDRAWMWVVLVGVATVPLSAIGSLRTTLLQGHEAVSGMAGLNAIVAAVGVASIVPLAWFFGLTGAVLQLLVVAGAYVLVSGWLLRPHVPKAPEREAAGPPPPRIDRSLLRPLLRYGSSALVVGLSSTLTLLVLRSVLVSKLGLPQNGIYQVCVGISGLYMPLILNSITAVLWPQIAAQKEDEEIRKTMRDGVRLAFLLMTAATGAMLAGAPIWIPLFYSGKFLPALDLLPIQFLGDYFRTAAWMFGIWLVPKNWLRPWVLFDIAYGVVMIVAFWLLVDRIGLRSVVFAYVAAHVTHAALHYFLARRSLGFRLGPDNRRLLLASFALLLGLATWTPRNPLGVALGLAALAAWATLVVRSDEWRAGLRRARQFGSALTGAHIRGDRN